MPTTLGFKVLKSGLISCFQDYGRYGFARYGLAQSGALDEHAYLWANYLLGNSFKAPALEIIYGQCVLAAQQDTYAVVTGADLDFTINDRPANLWQVLKIKKNDRLTWHYSKSGLCAYFAVAGGFKSTPIFNSSATNIRENIGQNIAKNDILPCASVDHVVAKTMPRSAIPDYTQPLTLRLLPTYQSPAFPDEARASFFHQTFVISKDTDRSGCRLEGMPLPMPNKKTMVSEGLVYGAVQITHQGHPIIMLKDYPTIGGYPKIGTVFSLDLAKLAQRMPGCPVHFKPFDLASAQTKRAAFNQFFAVK